MSHPLGVHVKPAGRRIRVLIADDHPVIRKTVRFTLEQHPRFESKPDVVVLNVSMLVLNGFEAAQEIKTSLPETAIVRLSSHTDQSFIEEARKIGARAYVQKQS
jgi:DNA-binding NarL/FixJ family response regulator